MLHESTLAFFFLNLICLDFVKKMMHDRCLETLSFNKQTVFSLFEKEIHPRGNSLIYPIQGRAVEQGMVLGLFVLKRIYNFLM